MAEGVNQGRPELIGRQHERLQRLGAVLLPGNRFYFEKSCREGWTRDDLKTLDQLTRLPLTTKEELLADQERHPPYGTCLSYPLGQYSRLHQTSGTKGEPLRWMDTDDSWQGLLDCWKTIFRIVGIHREDRLFFPFSFGPFLGFWTAFEAARKLGYFCIPAGGMTSAARLKMLVDNRVTFVFCTPTYALHLAQVSQELGWALQENNPNYRVRGLLVAGEPGGSIPATRARIEEAWKARVFDHSGLTEVGPMTIECPQAPGGLHVLEDDYFVEVIDPATAQPAAPGVLGEMVVTTLTRLASPVLRYRTGDLVRVDGKACPCGLPYLRLEGGILGRTDDMISIRGNNFFPGALENLLRRFPEIVEYRVAVNSSSPLAELEIDLETVADPPPGFTERVVQTIRNQLLFRAEVTLVPPGALPRFEMKALRVRRK